MRSLRLVGSFFVGQPDVGRLRLTIEVRAVFGNAHRQRLAIAVHRDQELGTKRGGVFKGEAQHEQDLKPQSTVRKAAFEASVRLALVDAPVVRPLNSMPT